MIKESRKDREARILVMLSEGTMDMEQIAHRLGYSTPSAASKMLRPMLEDGRITKFREPGSTRYQYGLS